MDAVILILGAFFFCIVRGQGSSCLTPGYAAPKVADGYTACLVATGFTAPRDIKFDSEGALLIVEQEKGISVLTLDYANDGTISESSRTTLITDDTLNHGIELSTDGATLYASNTRAVLSWAYDPKKQMTTSDSTTLVDNMTNSDHVSRTLLLSQAVPGMMIVTRGSTENVDPGAADISTGRSQVKAFNISNMNGPYDFNSQGVLMGWGLRNDVGVAEEPTTGGVYTVENSVDEMTVDGQDIHNTNPAEELNFLGYLNGTHSPNQGANFGYPECFTAWDVDTIPGFTGQVGQQFSIGSSKNDSQCLNRQDPRLAFHPHMAPLDIKFNDEGTEAWITFHGSWDSNIPVGYKLSIVAFANGEPVAPSTSKTAAKDIVWNHDTTACGDSTCMRPVGLAWDSKGRLFMSSDATGEIWAIQRANGKPINNNNNGGGATAGRGPTGTGTAPSSSSSSASAGATGMASATSFSGLAIAFGILAYIL